VQSNRSSCQILIKLEFSGHIFENKNIQITNIMKIRPVGAEFLHTTGREEEHDEVIVVFSKFCERA